MHAAGVPTSCSCCRAQPGRMQVRMLQRQACPRAQSTQKPLLTIWQPGCGHRKLGSTWQGRCPTPVPACRGLRWASAGCALPGSWPVASAPASTLGCCRLAAGSPAAAAALCQLACTCSTGACTRSVPSAGCCCWLPRAASVQAHDAGGLSGTSHVGLQDCGGLQPALRLQWHYKRSVPGAAWLGGLLSPLGALTGPGAQRAAARCRAAALMEPSVERTSVWEDCLEAASSAPACAGTVSQSRPWAGLVMAQTFRVQVR